MLLIGDDQPQPVKFHRVFDDGMGADQEVDFPCFELLLNLPAFCRFGGAGEQLRHKPQAGQYGSKGLIVLEGQDLCRRHQSRLSPGFGREIDAGRRYHGFARAHVSLDQPVHWHPCGHIPAGLFDAPALRSRQGEGQALIKWRQRNLLHGPGL